MGENRVKGIRDDSDARFERNRTNRAEKNGRLGKSWGPAGIASRDMLWKLKDEELNGHSLKRNHNWAGEG